MVSFTRRARAISENLYPLMINQAMSFSLLVIRTRHQRVDVVRHHENISLRFRPLNLPQRESRTLQRQRQADKHDRFYRGEPNRFAGPKCVLCNVLHRKNTTACPRGKAHLVLTHSPFWISAHAVQPAGSGFSSLVPDPRSLDALITGISIKFSQT